MAFVRDLQFALRSLTRAKGLTLTVVLTLALGIGANAAIVSLVRGVLLRPLVNRDEDRLIYIRQTALGIGADNAAFSVPELQDLRGGVTSLTAFGDFSTVGFTMVGLGEPRVVRAGVVGGSYFEVMGLHPVLGRLLDARDDGPSAAGAAVLTYRFWSTTLGSDPTVLGKTIRLDTRSAVVVGVLEPSVPYPAETEIIANVVTSPHHLSATMVTGRIHRMTELFGRLAPGATLESARAELRTVHAAMVRDHPESYSPKADFRIEAVTLRDQVTSSARTVLLVLLAASALVFVIAVSNVANLILARTVRREGELAIRAALGASRGALRRTLLAESLLLCSAGALLGVLSARPMVVLLAQYASRYSVRALDLTVDPSMLWVGAALALAAAVLLAFVPRLPNTGASAGLGLSSGSLRITGSTTRRLQMFATTQIAASFVLLAGAGMLLTTLMALQAAPTGLDLRNVLALDVPVVTDGTVADQKTLAFYREALRRIAQLPSVDRVAIGTTVPWRDAGNFGPGFEFSGDGHVKVPGEEDPRARFRTISPGFFASLGVPIIAGRDFTDADRQGSESVVIVSQSVAQAAVPESGRGQSPRDVDRSGHEVHQRQHRAAPYRRRERGSGRREHRARPGAEHLSPIRAGDRWRPAVRPYQEQRLRTGALDHPDHPRVGGRSTRRAGGDARRRARHGPGARSAEHAGIRRVRGRGSRDRGGRCGGRARVFGQRPHPRVRGTAGHRLATASTAHRRAPGGRGDGLNRRRRRGARRIRAGAHRRPLRHGRTRCPGSRPCSAPAWSCCWPRSSRQSSPPRARRGWM